MEPKEQDRGEFLVEQEQRLEAISDLVPYAQRLLFDWRYELTADDGTSVGCFVNARTRERLMVSADGRRFDHRDGGIVECDPGNYALRRALPSRRDWLLLLGGYHPGGLARRSRSRRGLGVLSPTRQTRAVASTSVDLLAPVHRLSVEQYARIAETGLFDSGPRVELIDGVIVEMSPIGRPHRRAVMWLNRALVPQLAEAHILSPQQAISLPALRSMPEPDIAILEVEEVLQRVAERPLLIIEVSDSSLRFDRITKSRLYARHGVPEYWIVNVADGVVEVHLGPTGDAWASRTVHGAGAVLSPHALPGVTVVLDELLAFIAGRA